jgi:hypothetical protein
MKHSAKLSAVMPLIRLAGEAAPAMPPRDRAAIFDGIAIITAGLDEHLHGHAKAAAQALRDAEGHQLTFAALLRQTNQATPRP